MGRRQCVCGHPIPTRLIEWSYMTGKLLRCTKCNKFTRSVTPDEVAGTLELIGDRLRTYLDPQRN